MKCARCLNPKILKAKKINYDYSEKCGIAGCFITAKEYRCPKCTTVFTDLGDDDEVNEAIAKVLITAKMLTRQMMKYVRVHFFKESEFVFAKRLSINPTVYADLETLKRPMNELMSEKVKEQLELHFIKKKIGNIKIVIAD